jgi:hypothetical protein
VKLKSQESNEKADKAPKLIALVGVVIYLLSLAISVANLHHTDRSLRATAGQLDAPFCIKLS